MQYDYKPYQERGISTQYHTLVEEIMRRGEDNISPMVDGNTGAELFTREIHGVVRHYSILNEGAPVIVERDISKFYGKAIDELFAFIDGVRTNDGLKARGCGFWDPWVTEAKCSKRGLETGDLGPGSYGAAFHDFPTAEGDTFNQFEEIVKQMKERPELKTHFISPWIPQYTIRNKDHQQKVVVCPCHGWIHFNIINGRLDMTMIQRSCDVILGLPSNLTQYTALLLAMSEVLGYKPGVFAHMISNAHIYNNTFEHAEELIRREPGKLPTLRLVNHHDSIFDYTSKDFELEDYEPHAKILKIPVGV